MKKIISALLCVILITASLPFTAFGATDSIADYIKANFPVSYQSDLLAVHKAHPKWTFTALKTNVKLSTAVSKEYNCKSATKLVDSVYADTNWACATSVCANASHHKQYGGANYSASKSLISDCMDPRNNFDVKYIFQFENLSFSSAHTASGIEKLLKSFGSFMYNTKASYYNTKGTKVTSNKLYSAIIYESAKANNVNAYFLAARICQEIGSSASYAGVSGKYKGYEGYYNFFNINATGSNVYANALAYAKSKGWTSPEKAINGGTQWLASGYIAKGQNTGYLQSFNVNPEAYNAMYTHQYMQTVTAARSEAMTTYSTYSNSGTLDTAKNFIIPVYTDADTTEPQVANRIFRIMGDASLSSVGYINCSSSVNVRKSTTTSSDLVASLPNKTKVTVTEKVHTDSFWYPCWYKISFTSGGKSKTGYIFSDYVALYYTLKLDVGKTQTLKLSGGYPASSSTFASSNTKAVTVSSAGKLTAKSSGSSTITVTSPRGRKLYCKVTVSSSAVTGIKLNASSLSLGVGETYTLTTTPVNSGAKAYTVTYASDKASLAKVDKSTGKVTAVSVGTAHITATTNNGKKAVCAVSVKPAPTSVKLSKSSITLGVGEKFTLTATLNSGSAGKVSYSSSNTGVATVSSSGAVTAKKAGTATLSVKTYNGKTAKCTVSVKKAPTSVKLNATALTLGSGEKYALKAALSSGSASFKKAFTSSKSSVASVSSSGTVTAKSAGTAVITIKTFNGKSAKCTVIVKKAPSAVSFGRSAYTLGVKETYKPAVSFNSGAYSRQRTFSSSNTSVLSVSSTGSITAKKAGKVTLAVKTFNGKTAKTTITVKKAPTGVKLNKSSISLKVKKTFTLKPGVNSGSASMKYTYTSSNTRVAKVSSSGKVTAVAPGSATVTVKTYNGKSAKCKVKVSGKAYAVVKSDVSKLNIRKKATTSSGVVTTAKKGAKMKITSTSGKWYKVSYTKSGKTYKGYVRYDFVKVKY